MPSVDRRLEGFLTKVGRTASDCFVVSEDLRELANVLEEFEELSAKFSTFVRSSLRKPNKSGEEEGG